jgi:cytochrome c oxidase assembly factor CtaG
VLLALVSPVDRLADQVLTMHMVQHLLLLDLAPVLCLVGLTRVLLRPVTRHVAPVERRAGPLAHPAFAAVLYVATMWVWHVPALYDAALEHAPIHVTEHLCFAIAGGLYWWHLLGPIRSRRRLSGLAPIGYMVGTKIAVGLLGIGLTFSPDALYAFYERQPHHWGMDAGTDQAVAGLVMALEQSIVMGIALAWLFVRALAESESDEQRAERYAA